LGRITIKVDFHEEVRQVGHFPLKKKGQTGNKNKEFSSSGWLVKSHENLAVLTEKKYIKKFLSFFL